MISKTRRKPANTTSPPGSTVFSTNLGWILVAWQDDQLTRISFGHPSPAAAAKGAQCEPVELDEAPKWIAKVIDKIKKFAAGKKVDWGNLPLAWKKQTDFQRRVQEACQKIPRGEVWSYGELAAAAGAPGAARAVGSVMRGNQFPLVIPCHRVVAAGGKLGGFSCPSGVEMKQKLLAAEGVNLK
jgi:methylated-DNA-[protein]-cysteine S-methyltransferase